MPALVEFTGMWKLNSYLFYEATPFVFPAYFIFSSLSSFLKGLAFLIQ